MAVRGGPLTKLRVSDDGKGFVDAEDKPWVAFGVNYFRPGTGWAPQVWKQFDAEATRQDFARMKELGVNCVRIFLSYGSFLMETNRLLPEGLAKLDQFLDIAAGQPAVYSSFTRCGDVEGPHDLPRFLRRFRPVDEHASDTELALRKMGEQDVLCQRTVGKNRLFNPDFSKADHAKKKLPLSGQLTKPR